MASQLENNGIIDSTIDPHNEVNDPVTQDDQNLENTMTGQRKRKRTSAVWEHFDLVENNDGSTKAVCKYCKEKFAYDGRGSSTSHLRRHSDNCSLKKVHDRKEKKQSTIPFQPSNSSNPFLIPGVKYTNGTMREIIATSIMVHEYPFNMVEDDVLMWGFQFANPDFQKITRKTIRSDCMELYEKEKKKLKAELKNVSKISLTTDMWRSSHQIVEYMVITGHFIDVGWKLQKRVLSFVKVPAPRRGVDVADAIFKCLKSWGIENKVFSVSVDNASYNDSCLRNLKDNLSLSNKLFLGGALFHVRCCAHILNLLVQDGLSMIKGIICNVRESVKYINHNDSRLKAFCDIVEQKHLKERKLVIDCPTRWNSTFRMLSTASKFKLVFPAYKEREPHYDFAPSHEDWEKVDKICKLLEVFDLSTHVISGSEYTTANLYLPEIWRVKQVIDNAVEDEDAFMREMAAPMKLKFEKYWGQCNLLMAIASVLDPRCKFHVVNICFPYIYKPAEVASMNIEIVHTSLKNLYDEYVSQSLEESSSDEALNSTSSNSSSTPQPSIATGFDQIMNLVREKEAIPPMKSELDTYLEESLHIPDGNDNTFCALDWWRNNSLKYKIMSKMAADILAIPISTVASESTFSAGGRIIDEFRSKLKEDAIEALICGGDWLRHKYGLQRKKKVSGEEEIILKI